MLRGEARKHLQTCRESIPAWIMPRYMVADLFPPEPELFDAIIVDEASQLDIGGLFLFYLAKKVIVVGDNMQISPLELALIVIILLVSNSNTLRILNTIRRCLLIAVFTTMQK